VRTAEAGAPRARDLRRRYTTADLDVLSAEELRRFTADGADDPQTDRALAWELLYRREPALYDRLTQAERLHPSVLAWLPEAVDRIVEVGAGSGRLTVELIRRAHELVAIEPAAPLREILARRLGRAKHRSRARVTGGFFDDLPVADDWADLVVACSAFTPDVAHGGEAGLAEMERVCRPGGRVALVWPNNVEWLAARGYEYVSFDGEMFVEFASREEAAELVEIFFPDALAAIAPRGRAARRISYETLGINPPRDVAFKAMPA
jgi:SAM-dependent methyltransferase